MPLCLSSWPSSWSKDSFIALTFWICLIVMGSGSSAYAAGSTPVADPFAINQTMAAQTPGIALTLTDKQSEYDAAPFMFYTRDPNSNLGVREVYMRHRNNLRGDHLAAMPINLSFDGAAQWLVLDIVNNSQKSDWFLDFGMLGDGRTGLARQVFVQDGGRGTTLIDTSAGVAPSGHAVFLRIAPGQTTTLVMVLTPNDHAPFVITPKIIEAGQMIEGKSASSENFMRSCILILMAGTSLFFLAGMFLRRGVGFFPHALFFISQGVWFWLVSGHIYGNTLGAGSLPGIALATGSLLALACTQSVIAAQANESSDSLVLYICASFVVLTIMLFMFVIPENTAMRLIVIGGSTILAYGVAAAKALSVQREMKWSGRMAGAAWIVMLIANFVPYLSGYNVLPLDPVFLQAPAIFMPLVCVLMVLSGTWYVRADNLNLVREILRQTKRNEAVSKLKQNKETADQARLLRVIEREREIMEDLRAREAERTEEMRLAKITADEANRAKSAFLAVVSHEIRTPMTGIMGMLRLLMDTQMTREQKDYSQTIQDSGDAMLALLNDILDFSKIEGGGLQLEEIDFDLHRVVGSVAMLMNGHATQRNIYLNTDIDGDAPRFLKGDPTRIRQVLLNLVGNAIKFTQRGGVTITLRAGDQKSAMDKPGMLPVMISVVDTGIGISEEAQKNLFNPFSQADSSIARKFGGTGLGLAICRRLIEAMGSDIELNSIEGQGTTFRFMLVLPAGDQKAAQAEGRTGDLVPSVSNLAKPMEILVVDDNAVNRKVMEGLLARDGHRVTSAVGGREAIDILEERSFQLVFMDIEMPGMNGLEAMKIIREHSDKRVAATPIVALTGNVGDDDRDRYKAAGMKDIVAKPIDPERLRNIILAHGHSASPKPVKAEPPVPVTMDFSDTELDEDTFAQSIEYQTTIRPPTEFDTIMRPPQPVAAEAPKQNAYVPKPPAPEPVKDVAPVASAAPAAASASTDFSPSMKMAPIPVAAAPASIPTALPPEFFNVASVNALKTSLGEGQLREMLDGVFAHNKSVLPTLQTAFNDGDNETLRGCAHELKGMNGNFGLSKLADLSGIIEKACRDGTVKIDSLDELIFNELPEAMALTERFFRGIE